MKQTAFQVKFNVLRPKYKPFVVSGIVLASSQPIAVATARQTLEKTLAESNNDSTVKLLTAHSLKNEFFLIAEEETVESAVNEKVKTSK